MWDTRNRKSWYLSLPRSELRRAYRSYARSDSLDGVRVDRFEKMLAEVLRELYASEDPRNRACWNDIFLGMPMALQAPPHRKRFILRYDALNFHIPMARLAIDLRANVPRMIEVDIVGEFVNSAPLNGNSLFPAIPHKL